MHAARADQWREVLTAAEKWAAGTGSRAQVEAELGDIAVIEEFHAYPGMRMMARLRERIAAGDATAVAGHGAANRRCHSHQCLCPAGGWRRRPSPMTACRMWCRASLAGREHHRPYFEVLLVTPQPAVALARHGRRVPPAAPQRG